MDLQTLKSLEEIASLLLSIHDFYLKDAYGSDILVALVTIIKDAQLSEKVSVLEAEKLRRKIMCQNEHQLGYELFYEWLRGIGKIIFKDSNDIGGKKGLHKLLSLYILPHCAKVAKERTTLTAVKMPYFTDAALEVMVNNSEFICLWFESILLEGNDYMLDHRAGAAGSSQATSCGRTESCSGWAPVRSVVESLRTCGVLTVDGGQQQRTECNVSEDDLESTLLLLPTYTTEVAIDRPFRGCLDFSSFLYLLELLSERACPPEGVEGGHGLQRLLQCAAATMLSCAMLPAEAMQNSYIDPSSLLKRLRQSGLVQLRAVDTPWLFEQLTIFSDYSDKRQTHMWPVAQLPDILVKIVAKVAARFLTGVSVSNTLSADKCVSLLMRATPQLLFYRDHDFPDALSPLYSVLSEVQAAWRRTVDCLQAASIPCEPDAIASSEWTRRFSECFVPADGAPRWSGDMSVCCARISAPSLTHYFQSVPCLGDAIPQLLDAELVGGLCHTISERVSDTRNATIPLSGVVEFLFVFTYNFYGVVELGLQALLNAEAGIKLVDVNGGSDGADEQFVIQVMELVERFAEFLVNVNKREGAKNSDVLWSVGDDAPQQSEDRQSPSPMSSLSQNCGSVSECLYPPPSPTQQQPKHSLDENNDFPLRDMAVLLAHFPLPSLALSPWEVAQLLALDNEANDPGHADGSLTALLRTFADRYSVSVWRLSEFFADFYSDSPASAEGQVQAKQQALHSFASRMLMDARTLRLLFLNGDLLKWEFGRCLGRYRRAEDPFTSGLVFPFPVEHASVTAELDDASERGGARLYSPLLVSTATALEWAASYGVDRHVSLRQMELVTLLGGCGTTRAYLTFSSFVVFAVRCFAGHLTEAHGEAVFVDEVRYMLHVFSQRLSEVQQQMRVRVLRLLYGRLDSGGEPQSSVGSDSVAVLEASLAVFGHSVTEGLPASISGVPPRPPTVFWDPPRFVEYCRTLGVLSGHEFSMELPWVAYGLCLRELAPPGVDLWDTDRIVPPVPLHVCDANTVHKLLRCLLVLANSLDELRRESSAQQWGVGSVDLDPSMAQLCWKTVTPVVCMMVDRQLDETLSAANGAATDSLWVEDILRYGGSEAMQTLSSAQSFLLMAYYSVCRQSQGVLVSPARDEDGSEASNDALHCEASLNLVCKFMAANSLLRIGAVAVHARRSLHARLRPVVQSPGSLAGATVPAVSLSFAEFEELFLRCAFAQWEATGSLAHPLFEPDVGPLLGGDGSATASAARVAMGNHYRAACADMRRARSETLGRQKKPTMRRSWGVDFLYPFAATMLAFAEVVAEARAHFEASGSGSRNWSALQDGEFRPVAQEALRCAVSVQSSSRVQSWDEAVLPDIVSGRLKYAVADPADRRKDSPPPQAANSRSQRVTFATMDGHSSPHLLNDVAAAAAEPSPKALHTSKEVISLSSERAQLLQESSDQLVVALEALLAGTKEALWPVYATYCSCGDSLDPGKLSGPNLFTLLSKLGVLTDRTLLSDIGILLHQVSSHTLCASAIITVESLSGSSSSSGRTGGRSASLTFEEFLVFLCAFSVLRFEGGLVTAAMMDRAAPSGSGAADNWYGRWQRFMSSSQSFRRLLAEHILPVLQKRTLLAFPEDARLRDRFSSVFSAEVLAAVEGAEGPLQQFFRRERRSSARSTTTTAGPVCSPVDADNRTPEDVEVAGILTAMRRLRLVPEVVPEQQVLQLIADVLPEQRTGTVTGERVNYLLFPQWEWVLSVVACQAVETAIQMQGGSFTAVEKIPLLVADVITSIAGAMTTSPEAHHF